MAKYFNTTGPCFPRLHYMLPPKDRLIGASLDRYIRDELYWVLHAPRQTGKTTFLHSWMHEINAGTEAVACYVTLETCQEVIEVERAMPTMVDAVRQWAKRFELPVPGHPSDVAAESMLSAVLTEWAEMTAPRKLIVFFDEVDVVAGPAMVSFLRQLRGGFAGRGAGSFPVSVALVGMRDLRNYLVSSKDGSLLNPGSPFNIKEDSVTLTNFSREDITALTSQHTGENGQVFTPEALDRIFACSSGQPWLVNALAKECVLRIVPEAGTAVRADHVDQAKERLIASRATHIDSLSVRLREPRIRKIIQPILTGASDPTMADGDDFTFCLDLGIVAFDEQGTPGIANAIYREVFARDLSYGMQVAVPPPEFRWQQEDGSLDMEALMDEFQKFWAWNSEIWEEKADYTEAFPHLLLMAFLQRVINGGGTVDREYAAGRGRMDLLLRFGGGINLVEIKLVHLRMGREATRDQGLEQVDRYADRTSPHTCHLVIFDRRPDQRTVPWEERLGRETCTTPSGRAVEVVWC
ncbi:ATP-binding protein [Candidatus Electrothrix sp.]|uniref:ATP-binding protein n=1 Tax=Candidatus Electrothrix sp. TaxID=2170559 RepID=UPI004055BD45